MLDEEKRIRKGEKIIGLGEMEKSEVGKGKERKVCIRYKNEK